MSRWLSVCLWGVVVAALGSCGTLRRPPDPDRKLDVRVAGSAFESALGYRFAVLPEPSTKLVRLEVRYPVGSADDPPGKAGLAHLVEHLLLEVEIPRGEGKTSIAAETARLALSYNAETTADYTSYWSLAAPAALDELIALEADRLTVGCAGLTREIVAREREVVINELRQRQGASGAALARSIFEAVYPAGHPYRVVDGVDSVAKLELEDVCGFLTSAYRRGHVVVVASGAVDAAALQQAVGRHFGRLPKRVLDAPPKVAGAPVVPGTTRVKGDVDEPVLIATWPLPPRGTRDYRLLEMAWSAIAGRLEQFAYVYKWGHGGDATVIGGAHAPVLAVSINLNSAGNLDEAVSAVRKSVEHAWRMVQSTGEEADSGYWIRRWEARAESLLARWESIGGRGDMQADFMMFEPGSSLVKQVDELAKSTPGETRQLAEAWLAPRRARYVLIEPSGQSGVGGRTYLGGGAASHGVRVDHALADRPIAVPGVVASLDVERYTTSNGLTVVMWPHGTAPLVQGRLVVGSGKAHDPVGKEGIAHLVGPGTYADHSVFYGRELATRADLLIASLTGELRTPTFNLDDDSKDYLKARLRQRRAKERQTYARDLLVAAYGEGHPYARVAMTEDSVDKLSRDVVTGWARDHVVPRNSTLIVAGKFDAGLLKRHIAYQSDQVSAGSESARHTVRPSPTRRWIAGVTDKASPTVQLDVHVVGGIGIDRDHARRLVLAEVLTAELANLRGERAVTYGFSASFEPRRAGGLWTVSGEVDATRAGEAAAALVTILERLRRDPEASRGSFVLARQKVLEALVASTTTSAAVVETLEHMVRFDLPDDYAAGLAAAVAKLTLADFHPFIARELGPNGQVFGAFGNREAAAAAVAAAKAAVTGTDP